MHAFCTVNPNAKIRPAEAVPQESGVSARHTTMSHTDVPEPTACEHDEVS